MKIDQIKLSLKRYEGVFDDFVTEHRLPGELFAEPDHFAIKCADQLDYFDTCSQLVDFVSIDKDGIWELTIDGRSLASTGLVGEVLMSSSDFNWVEIMQPKPGKEIEEGFVEHTEFYYPDFLRAEHILNQRGVDYEFQRNPGHGWINITLDDHGREIKLNDKPLADVVMWEKEQGLLRKIRTDG